MVDGQVRMLLVGRWSSIDKGVQWPLRTAGAAGERFWRTLSDLENRECNIIKLRAIFSMISGTLQESVCNLLNRSIQIMIL